MTSTFILAPGEEFVQCPYNRSHLITNAKFTIHLKKCRDNYKKSLTIEGQKKDVRICRYNHNHHCWKPELKWHEEHCPSSFSSMQYKAYHESEEAIKQYEEIKKKNTGGAKGNDEGNGKVKPKVNEWGLEEEDWEEENSGAAGYDPSLKLKEDLLLVNPKGMTKSERKQYRTDLRKTAAKRELLAKEGGEHIELPSPGSYDIDANLERLSLSDGGEKVGEKPPIPSSSASVSRPKKVASVSVCPSTDLSSKLMALGFDDEVDTETDSDDFSGIDPYQRF